LDNTDAAGEMKITPCAGLSVGLLGRLVEDKDQGEEEDGGQDHVEEFAEVRVGECDGHRVVIRRQ
jgi:hypothetical protein